MRNALALLDQQHVDETGERIAQQREVSLPVFRRVRQRTHLIERQRQCRAIALFAASRRSLTIFWPLMRDGGFLAIARDAITEERASVSVAAAHASPAILRPRR